MYVKRILPNGVRLITERIDNMRTVSVGIWVGNGSRYEPALPAILQSQSMH